MPSPNRKRSSIARRCLCYVQMHPSIAELMKNAEVGVPYPGAKPRYILDIDHASYACRVIATLWEHIT